jgi:hypothetical protein
MPNRKTFDDREKFDHSAHRSTGPEPGDLAATPNSTAELDDGAEAKRTGENADQ